MFQVSGRTHRRNVRLGGLLCLLFIFTAAWHIPNAYAVTYDLTGNGLGLPEGNYEPSITVAPELTLSALTSGNATGYPTGIPGIVFLHLTDGAGVRWGDIGNSSKRISGWGIGSYESLVLGFSAGVSAQSITMWFNKIQVYAGGDIVPFDLWVTPFSASAFQISDLLSYLHYTDDDTAYVVFSELPDLNGIGCIERIIVRAAPNYHLYVSQVSYQSCVDNDDDGYPADSDCDDSDPDVNPGAVEICNGVDDNCDGDIDEECVTYYRDADGDGWGDPGDSVTATSPPAGYVATSGDCDDTDRYIYPGASERCNGLDDDCDWQTDEGCTLYYRDADGDGYGNPGDSTTVPQSGYVPNAGDCNDSNANVNPGESEICNAIDDNCDNVVDEGCVTYFRDADGDTYGDPNDSITSTSPPSGYVTNAGDCDDGNAAINPGAGEICNSVDDNCDGNIDEGCSIYYRDADGDNYGDPTYSVVDTTPPSGYVADSSDCDDTDVNVYPGAQEQCNSADDDCDGQIDEGCPPVTYYYPDTDGDGYGDPGGSPVTTPTSGYVANNDDCDDTESDTHPGATEQCNSVDDDCDGAADEGCVTYYEDADGDGWGNANSATAVPTGQRVVHSPAPPPGYVANAGDCDDTNPNIHPGATEVCNNGIDEDCNGFDASCAFTHGGAQPGGGITVGGVVVPVNKIGLLAPWIGAALLFIACVGLAVRWRQKKGPIS